MQWTSQFERGCFKCGGPHLAWECPKQEGGSSRVAGAQVEIEEEEEEEGEKDSHFRSVPKMQKEVENMQEADVTEIPFQMEHIKKEKRHV